LIHIRNACFDWFIIFTVLKNVYFFLVDELKVDGNGPEEEILSVLDVPPGKMGCIIGKKGASIMSIKESCK